jgi:hypothetical protein
VRVCVCVFVCEREGGRSGEWRLAFPLESRRFMGVSQSGALEYPIG